MADTWKIHNALGQQFGFFFLSVFFFFFVLFSAFRALNLLVQKVIPRNYMWAATWENTPGEESYQPS